MYKLEIKLKQHTPLIHFQHDQQGATLRASEVKPKLDRFIINQLGGEDGYERGREIAAQNGWLIRADTQVAALNYKMRISADEKNKRNISIQTQERRQKHFADYPFLLANMGGKENEDELINFSFYAEVSVNLLGSDDSLKKRLCELLPAFFFYHNFGQRNSKGFGCFSVEKIDDCSIIEFVPSGINYFKFPCRNDKDGQTKLFDVLDYYYKRLKSGINYTGRKIDNNNVITYRDSTKYRKSFLSTYIARLSEGNVSYKWDKPKIKCELRLASAKGNGGKGSESYNSDDKHIYARALLGMPDKYEYIVKRAVSRIWNDKIGENETRYQVDVEGQMERMPSPLLFKPYFSERQDEVIVYLLIDSLKAQAIADVDGSTVKFIKKENRDKRFVPCNPPAETSMPIKSRFSNNIFDYNNLIECYHKELQTDFVPINFRGYNLVERLITIGKTR